MSRPCLPPPVPHCAARCRAAGASLALALIGVLGGGAAVAPGHAVAVADRSPGAALPGGPRDAAPNWLVAQATPASAPTVPASPPLPSPWPSTGPTPLPAPVAVPSVAPMPAPGSSPLPATAPAPAPAPFPNVPGPTQ